MAVLELTTPWLMKLLSFIFWGNLYLYTMSSVRDRSPEWCSRMVTLLHGGIATIVGLYQCGCSKGLDTSQLTKKVMPSQYALMLWSWGYFAFDLLWCSIYWSDAILMLCHHASALGAITIYMQKDYTGCTYACTLVLMEITNPLLQTRWFLKQEGYANTSLFLFIEILYLTLFFGLRGILGTCIMYYILKTDYFCTEQKLISLSLYVVSVAFMYDIMGYILYKYKREINIGFEQFAAFCHTSCLTFNEWQPLDTHMQEFCFQTMENDADITPSEVKDLHSKIIAKAVLTELTERDTEILAKALSAIKDKNQSPQKTQ